MLLDPSDDSIPRGTVRQYFPNTGRIVQLSLSRETQQPGALRALNGAFPFLRGAATKSKMQSNFVIFMLDITHSNRFNAEKFGSPKTRVIHSDPSHVFQHVVLYIPKANPWPH